MRLLDPLPKALPPPRARDPLREEAAVAGLEARRSYEGLTSLGNPFARVPQHQNLGLYDELVEMVPVINAALKIITRLVGTPTVMVDDPLKTELTEWMMDIRVNQVQTGFGNWFYTWILHHLKYGRSHAEIILTNRRDDIYALQQLHTRTIELKPRDRYGVDLVQTQPLSGIAGRILPRPVILTAVHDLQDDNPNGCSLLFGMPFVTEILTACFKSVKGLWERFGNPSFQVQYIPPDDMSDPTGATNRTHLSAMMTQFQRAMASRREGKARDFGTVGQVEIKVIGAAGEELDFTVPYRTICEQIVALTGIPPILLGFQWQAGERIGAVQAGLVGEGLIKHIRHHVESELLYLFSLVQLLRRGSAQPVKLGWEAPTLLDAAETAKAELTQAQADSARLKYDNDLLRQGALKPEDIVRRHREEWAEATDEEIRSEFPDLSAMPMIMPTPLGGGGMPGEQEPAGVGGTFDLQRRGALEYSRKTWNGNGRH